MNSQNRIFRSSCKFFKYFFFSDGIKMFIEVRCQLKNQTYQMKHSIYYKQLTSINVCVIVFTFMSIKIENSSYCSKWRNFLLKNIQNIIHCFHIYSDRVLCVVKGEIWNGTIDYITACLYSVCIELIIVDGIFQFYCIINWFNFFEQEHLTQRKKDRQKNIIK